MSRIFYWDDWNEAHIAEHAVTRQEAEAVVRHPSLGFPRLIGDDKYLCWGKLSGGRQIQVIFVYRPTGTIDLMNVGPAECMVLHEANDVIYVIHARDLTEAEKRQLRKKKRSS